MAAVFWKIDSFEEGKETWEHYCERLGHYFIANGIGDTEEADLSKRRSILLSVCGSKIYKLMSDLLAPNKPGTKTFAELVKLVQDHYAPKPSEIVQRYKFHNRFRSPGESVASYVAELRHLTEHCNFGQTMEVMIRDRLVCGIMDDKIQRRLLAEKDLTFKKAYEIAISMETAAKGVVDLQSGQAHAEKVNKVCEGEKLLRDKRNLKCYYCHMFGHAVAECRKKKADQAAAAHRGKGQSTHRGQHRTRGNSRGHFGSRRSKSNFRRENVHNECDTSEDEEGDHNEYTLYHMMEQGQKPPYRVSLNLNGVDQFMELDTGASKTVISEEVFNDLCKSEPHLKLQPSATKLRTYTGELIPILGTVQLRVTFNEKQFDLKAEVVKGKTPCLLGRDCIGSIPLNSAGMKFFK